MAEKLQSILVTDRRLSVLLIALLLGLGLAIRLYDLTDLPLDFHPTRQLLSHLKARGMYYRAHPDLPDWQRKMAIQQWRLRAEVEPEVFERLVASTYDLTGVQTSVARVYASMFWVAAGLFLFLLVRQLASYDAAVIALTYFLFNPFAIAAGRSFQPDVLMMLLVACFWWAFHRWTKSETWLLAILAGITGGLAIFVKFIAVFFVVGAAVGLGVGSFGSHLWRKRQIWVMAVIGVLPPAIYLFYGLVLEGFLGRQFAGRFIPALLVDPLQYLRWAEIANRAAGGVAIALGLLGYLAVRTRPLRWLLAGLWIGYLAFGLFFNYHVGTHDYYHLPLIAIAAVSAAPVVDLLIKQLAPAVGRATTRLAMLGILLYAAFAGAWEARRGMAAVDYRPEADMWAEIGERLKHGPNVVALTQDYGSRLAYWGWQNSIVWPYSGDFEYRNVRGGELGFDEAFTKLTAGNAYFLVTDFDELERQTVLGLRLEAYRVYAEADGYVIYDLESLVGP